jgi:phosphoribosylglycinamide formyltransferase-1
MKKIVVLFSQTGSNFEYLAKHLHKKEAEIVLAITNNPNAKGIEVAKKYNIPLKIIDNKNYPNRESFDAKLVETILKLNPDLTILAGFMRILTPTFTENIKAINLHPSLLPRHKGLHAIERSYEDEFDKGGVSVHYVTSELDGGEIILQKAINKKNLSFEEYYQKIRSIEKEALLEATLKVLAN